MTDIFYYVIITKGSPMLRLLVTGILLLGIAAPGFPRTDGQNQAEFFAGLLLLQSDVTLPADQKAIKYRELQAMTGITSGKAAMLLKGLRETPEDWSTLQTAMTPLLAAAKSPAEGTNSKPSPTITDKENPHVRISR